MMVADTKTDRPIQDHKGLYCAAVSGFKRNINLHPRMVQDGIENFSTVSGNRFLISDVNPEFFSRADIIVESDFHPERRVAKSRMPKLSDISILPSVQEKPI